MSDSGPHDLLVKTRGRRERGGWGSLVKAKSVVKAVSPIVEWLVTVDMVQKVAGRL